ncbi:hypothetical protein BJ742DRAFT_782793 [Cladochytrium replicatum]|nr:hypothetical protein BJ742DRAFT_782793 [Cladochytrium replicatum]
MSHAPEPEGDYQPPGGFDSPSPEHLVNQRDQLSDGQEQQFHESGDSLCEPSDFGGTFREEPSRSHSVYSNYSGTINEEADVLREYQNSTSWRHHDGPSSPPVKIMAYNCYECGVPREFVPGSTSEQGSGASQRLRCRECGCKIFLKQRTREHIEHIAW